MIQTETFSSFSIFDHQISKTIYVARGSVRKWKENYEFQRIRQNEKEQAEFSVTKKIFQVVKSVEFSLEWFIIVDRYPKGAIEDEFDKLTQMCQEFLLEVEAFLE